MKLQLAILLAFGLANVALANQRVSTDLYRSLVLKQSADIIISFHGSRTYELRSTFRARAKTLASRGQRLNTLYATLKNHADETQASVINFLRESAVSHSQLWISNQVIIRNANLLTVQKLLAFPEIAQIRESRQIPMIQPIDVIHHPEGFVPNEEELAWGVEEVAAPEVWAQGNRGENVTVGIIDSGIRPTHSALKNRIRPEYGWFFPGKLTEKPGDSMGHGTHVAGSIAGETKGIGVAPGAQIIACRACGLLSCAEADLLDCGQWVACPTRFDGTDADCTKAPQLVSNSWGGGNEADPFYEEVIDTWVAAGIIPVFALGNSGPACGTANAPGDSANVIGVGSINKARQVSSFSSVGPTAVTGRIKPEIAAPGTNIYSASYYGDNTYATMSGTSMATPHVSGLIALVLSANPDLDFEDVKGLLAATALPHTPQSKNCGGISDSTYPNNHVGAGVVNAPQAVAGAQKLRRGA